MVAMSNFAIEATTNDAVRTSLTETFHLAVEGVFTAESIAEHATRNLHVILLIVSDKSIISQISVEFRYSRLPHHTLSKIRNC